MWQIQYLRALDLSGELLAEADRERLARSATISDRERPPRLRRGIAAAARMVVRTAASVEAWAEPRAA